MLATMSRIYTPFCQYRRDPDTLVSWQRIRAMEKVTGLEGDLSLAISDLTDIDMVLQ